MKYLFLLPVAVSVLFLIPGCSGGQHDDHPVALRADSVHNGWFFAAGDTVNIDGTVNGDVYAAGGIVDVKGVINGDLLVAGGIVTMRGIVSDDIRAGGGRIEISGSVGKNVTIAGANMVLSSPALIDGSLLMAGGTASLDGLVGEELKAATGSLTINGGIVGNAEFAGGSITIGPTGRIGGDLTVRVEDADNVDIDRRKVAGEVAVSVHVEEDDSVGTILGFEPFHFWGKVFWLGSLLLAGVVLAFVFPRQTNSLGAIIGSQPGEVTLWGLGSLFLVPLASVILVLTIIGIPLGLFFLGSYLWMLYFSQVVFGIFAGQLVLGNKERTGWPLFGVVAGGVVILQALTFVPIVGFIVIAAGMIFGSGALGRALYVTLSVRR